MDLDAHVAIGEQETSARTPGKARGGQDLEGSFDPAPGDVVPFFGCANRVLDAAAQLGDRQAMRAFYDDGTH